VDDLVDFFRSEDLVDGVGMERIKLIIVHLELACFYTHNQVGEHWISLGNEGMTSLLINLFIKTEYESYSVMYLLNEIYLFKTIQTMAFGWISLVL
jgi:hypothetical protein